uniref:Secreted protein n=1 Tax=Aegilops tauschii subsp. strangulata TaxID=200361 RepID=A0A453KN92_AEGTS
MGARRTPCGWRLLFFLGLLAEVHGSSSPGVKAVADALPPTSRLFPAEGTCARQLQMHCSISAIGRFPSPFLRVRLAGLEREMAVISRACLLLPRLNFPALSPPPSLFPSLCFSHFGLLCLGLLDEFCKKNESLPHFSSRCMQENL